MLRLAILHLLVFVVAKPKRPRAILTMSSESLLATPQNYGTVQGHMQITVESAQSEHDVHDGFVSFHDVSYEVSSLFGRKKKVILNTVR